MPINSPGRIIHKLEFLLATTDYCPPPKIILTKLSEMNSRFIRAVAYDSCGKVDFTGGIPKLTAIMPNKSKFTIDGEVIDGDVYVQLTSLLLTQVGTITCEISVEGEVAGYCGGQSNTVFITPTFYILVSKTNYDPVTSGILDIGYNTNVKFDEATARENIISGERLNVLFGKISKWFTDLRVHAFQSPTSVMPEDGKASDSRVPSEKLFYDTLKGLASFVLDAVVGLSGMKLQGNWNANTNSPELPDATESGGNYYIVKTTGTHGGIKYEVDDWVFSDGTKWARIENGVGTSKSLGMNEDGIITVLPDVVQTYDNHYQFPLRGRQNGIYIDREKSRIYRWDDTEKMYYCVGSDFNNIEIIDGGVF